ncbi:hypothetical protein AcV5_008041 [Taiwanofungus camphoratus]|nr:hypothetical protein AcV5_008041 [Antrodia cinnamomea]
MRTYALYDRRKMVLCLLVATCLVGGSLSTWAIISRKRSDNDAPPMAIVSACGLSLSVEQGHHFACAWSSMLVFDTLVFSLTLVKSIQMRHFHQGSLLQIMLRDGTIYFCILAASNAANILTFLLADPSAKGINTTLTNVLSATLISRLMLNLRDPSIRVHI